MEGRQSSPRWSPRIRGGHLGRAAEERRRPAAARVLHRDAVAVHLKVDGKPSRVEDERRSRAGDAMGGGDEWAVVSGEGGEEVACVLSLFSRKEMTTPFFYEGNVSFQLASANSTTLPTWTQPEIAHCATIDGFDRYSLLSGL